MTNEAAPWSGGFRRLYCDSAIYDSFSSLHPISFQRVLPFQSSAEAMDDLDLIAAEEAHLAARNDATRRDVVQAYCRYGLLSQDDAANLGRVTDYFETDFFELMGLAYANAGKFRCALRWYREQIRALETQNPNLRSDEESVYASVGYCLHGLGLFAEAVAWSKSCIGPRQMADTICQAVINYEAQSDGSELIASERSGPRTRYTIASSEPDNASERAARLKSNLQSRVFSLDVYIAWIKRESPTNPILSEGYPFRYEVGGDSLLRHRMNLIFATCGQADALTGRGYIAEAKRLLEEALMIEANAAFLSERLELLRHQSSR